MTETEIKAKIEQYKLSDAPIEVKMKAIKELETKLVSQSSQEKALSQFIEGQADLDDIPN